MKQWFDLSMSLAISSPQGRSSTQPDATIRPSAGASAPATPVGSAWLSDALKAWCAEPNAQ